MTIRIALIGDHDTAVTAHRAIPLALTRAGADLGSEVEAEWFGTDTLNGKAGERLAGVNGIWCVPASPYRSEAGALSAIRYARERRRPFLGTCGGFQHALLEYARHVAGIRDAAHAETDADAAEPMIAPLSCELVERSGEVRLVRGSRLATLHGSETVNETYHCRYGLSASWEQRLSGGALRVAARDMAGEVRAMELTDHPFFVLTLYQPERAALAGRSHPLITAFVAAAR